MTVTFVIPHHQNLSVVKAAVRSIEGLSRPSDCAVEVIIVDNASREGAAAWAEENGCRAIRLAQNAGFSAAVNRGIQDARGEQIVVLNDDVELSQEWLQELNRALDATPSALFACGKMIDHADRGCIDGVGDAICRGGVSWRLGHGRRDGPAFDRSRRTFFPSATATLYQRRFFDQIGLFDEAFFAYLEDVDLGLRAALAGLGGCYVPSAIAYHRGSSTGRAWSSAMVRWITAHQILLLAKFYRPRLLLRFFRNIAVAQCLWAAMAISRGRTIAWIQGMAMGLMRARGSSRARPPRELTARLEQVLSSSESEIERVQKATGFDRYWKWYFRLAGSAARG